MTPPHDDLTALRSAIAGSVVTPSDEGWDAARAAWNTAADRQPDLIALPRSTADVVAIVAFARAAGLRIAPQCSGHNASALPPLTGTVLVSTTNMAGASVDPVSRTLRVEAGTCWGTATSAIDQHGLFAASGSSPDVGVVGYVLGGGLSLMGRTLGLAANHVTSLDVVTPDGAVHTATAKADADLFWALRGGGANFGIVTAMELQLFPLTNVTAGMFVWPYAQRADVVTAWYRWTRTAPQDATTSLRLITFPPSDELPPYLSGQSVVIIDGTVVGGDAEPILADLRALHPHVDTWTPRSAGDMEHLHLDPGQPVPFCSTTALLDDIDDIGLSAFADLMSCDDPLMFVELRHLGGALAAEGSLDGGATCGLPGEFLLYAVGVGFDATAIEPALAVARTAMAPYANGKCFANFAERPTDSETLFCDNSFQRLQHLRARIDPNNVMLAAHPISPGCSRTPQ
ncbi:MAG: FAD-binding oxidoreductase [Mycobacterium kyogaense]|uniref:FAD-binding oxidoreductase n=1 Tax=Mycobacterium kyogaense TaxID=2212479 RepID=UPI002FF50E0B